jgi:hypothetical protein
MRHPLKEARMASTTSLDQKVAEEVDIAFDLESDAGVDEDLLFEVLAQRCPPTVS